MRSPFNQNQPPRALTNHNQLIQIDDVEGEGPYEGNKELDEVALIEEFVKYRRGYQRQGHKLQVGRFG